MKTMMKQRSVAWTVAMLMAGVGSRLAAAEIDATARINRQLPDCGIQAVIDEAGTAGGGTVVLPAGRFPLSRSLVLRSGVTLKGQGADTVLAAAVDEHRAMVAADCTADATTIELDGDLSTLAPGRMLHVWIRGRDTHPVHRKQSVVKSVAGTTITLAAPFGIVIRKGKAFVSWGLHTSVLAAARAGEQSVRVADPSVFTAGAGITLTGPGDGWNHHWNQVERIDGDTLHLAWPLTVAPAAGSIAQRLHSLITAEGVGDVGIEDLSLEGFADARKPSGGGFYLAALHTNETRKVAVRRVTVRDWHSDAFSFQNGGDLVVEDCTATRNFGHGFHPGTGWKGAEFVRITSADNATDGLYYCWSNHHVNVRDSKLTGNGGHGIGGLGIPGDTSNVVDGNLIEGNGLAGVEMIGGSKGHGNTVVRNTIRDNSRAAPGKQPGVLITAIWNESPTGAIVRDNVIESTLAEPTQWVGVEERHVTPLPGKEDKADPSTGLVMVDESMIEGNRLRGHKTADVLVRGRATKATGNEGRVVEERP